MTTGKSVIFTFRWRREGLQTSQFAVGTEFFAASRQDLVTIGLMTYIPYDTVLGGVEDVMECYGDFHHTKTRCQMTRVYGHFLDNVLTQFLTELRQLVHLQSSEIFWILYLT